MRKKMLITTAAVMTAGIIAAILRLWEVRTIFEPETGLATRYAPVSILLVALTAAVIAKAVWYSFSVEKKGQINVDLERPFPVSNELISIIIGIIIAVCSAFNYVIDVEETTIFKAVFAVLGILAGVSICVSTKVSKGTWACFPALFMCYWLVLTYKENNTNPVLIEYCYECLAAAAATLSSYYAAGHYYGKLTPKRTVITHLLGIYFCLLTASDAGNIAQSVIFAALAVYQLIKVCAYIMGSPDKKIEE